MGGTECLSVSNSGKTNPHDYFTPEWLLIPSFHMVENWLIQKQVLKRLKPMLFVLSIIQEECKNYKANNWKLSNLTGLRKNILLPGNTLLPCSESNPKCFYNEISLCLPSPTTHHSPVPSPPSQVNVPRKQSSLHLKCFLFLPSPSHNALFFCPKQSLLPGLWHHPWFRRFWVYWESLSSSISSSSHNIRHVVKTKW